MANYMFYNFFLHISNTNTSFIRLKVHVVGWKAQTVIQAAEVAGRNLVVFTKVERQTPHLTPSDRYQGYELK